MEDKQKDDPVTAKEMVERLRESNIGRRYKHSLAAATAAYMVVSIYWLVLYYTNSELSIVVAGLAPVIGVVVLFIYDPIMELVTED